MTISESKIMERYRINESAQGFDFLLEEGGLFREGARIHVGYCNSEFCLIEYAPKYSRNLTDDMLEMHIAHLTDDKYEYGVDDDKDLTTRFTEVWYDVKGGKAVEIIREETTYSDRMIRDFIEPKQHLPEVST